MRLSRSLLRLPALLLALWALGASAEGLVPDLTRLDSLPLHVAPQPVLPKSELLPDKSRPLQFAVKLPLALTLADGVWDSADGLARWRSRVYSAGAKSLSLEFAEFHLPAGASLWLYDAAGALVQGPYTPANHTPEGRLWTALVEADTAIIELRVPVAARDEVRLKLAGVAHGYREFSKAAAAAGSAKSGSCNIDVVCSQGNAWRDEIRSVAHIVTSGTTVCTGQLVNNVRQDNTPLLLTANHCQAAAAASSVVAYWNYQTSSCGGAPNGSLAQSQAGASLRAFDNSSDFTLLQLNTTPLAAYNVHYAGWNASTAVPQSGVTIHHPAGDEKRISLYSSPGVSRDDTLVTGIPGTLKTWNVRWTAGTTEQGSSGAGLWNEQHQLVGVLSGGDASCSNPGGTDSFGRINAAWTAGSANSGQLKAHLDPGNTGRLAMCGKNPGASCTPPGEVLPPGSPPATSGGGGGGAFGLMLMMLMGAAPFLRRSR